MIPSAFPAQPDDLPWPTIEWPGAEPTGDVNADRLQWLIDAALAQPPELGLTLAVAAIHRGRLVAEAYGPDTDRDSTLISWSMAKSITHAAVGLLVGDGLIDLDAPVPVAAWANDDRRQITMQQLLNMSSGLHFVEDYVDAGISHVIEMLFGAGIDDHARYAADLPLDHQPGTVWNYASGTTNIIARIVGDLVGGGQAGMIEFLQRRLFDPLGMASATPKFDTAGTFVGSSYVYASALDFARFGYLYLRDGRWGDRQLLPAGWVDHARTPITAPLPAHETHGYGAQWWLWRHSRSTFFASGYEGQRTVVSPERDLVIVRLGKSPSELSPSYDSWLDQVISCFPTTAAQRVAPGASHARSK